MNEKIVDFSKYKDGDDFLQQTGLDIDDALKILKDERRDEIISK